MGQLPSGGLWVPRDGSCSSGMFSMGVSAEKLHGGSRSLKVTNHSWPQCRLAGRFDAVDEFWVRAYLYWHLRQPNKLSAQTYIDGRALMYQSSGKPVSVSIETTDTISQKVNHLRLGFFTHNSTGAGNVFIDDVVVARDRVGCGQSPQKT